jgi:hypothetical protein
MKNLMLSGRMVFAAETRAVATRASTPTLQMGRANRRKKPRSENWRSLLVFTGWRMISRVKATVRRQ